MGRNGQNNFDLVGDGDDVDLIEWAEQVFALKIADNVAASLQTFGDLFDQIETNIVVSQWPVCLLRKAWQDVVLRTGQPCHPRTNVSDMGVTRSSWIAAIRLEDEPPRPDPAEVLVGAAVVLFVLTLARDGHGWSALGLGALSAGAAAVGKWLEYRRVNRLTLADLLRQEFHGHYALQSRTYGHGTARDRWVALESLCRAVSGYSGPVDRSTKFFPHANRQGA